MRDTALAVVDPAERVAVLFPLACDLTVDIQSIEAFAFAKLIFDNLGFIIGCIRFYGFWSALSG